MKIVIATDIHGTNAALRAQLATLGDPIIISPWPVDGRPYSTEQEAVSEFHRQDGLSAYERKIADIVDDQAACLVGFSVGASSLWRYVSSPRCNPGSCAFLYYGSRIREHATLVPRCRTSLIFAEHETSFDPLSIASALALNGVQCDLIGGTYHGFMNPASIHFHPDIARDQFERIRAAFAAHRSANGEKSARQG